MSKLAVIFFLAALLALTGCVATTEKAPPLSEWSETNVVASPVYPTWPVAAPPVKTNTAVRPRPAPAQVVKPPPVYTFTSLNVWAAGHKLNPPALVARSPVMTYSVSSTNGVFTFAIGSREATWNGMEMRLGFSPELVDGQVFVHGLDLRHNFEPLLTDPPLVFGTNRVAVIDPGHGGSNVGTRSVVDGRFEKEFTLDWARRLVPLLESNGWKVYLTRSSDVLVTNSWRPLFANAQQADVFISLHFNSSAPDQNPRGLAAYCLTPTGMPSNLTRGYADPTYENLPNNACDMQNLQLAMRLQRALLHATGLDDRGVERARFMEVLRWPKCPAVLLEGGFLSNPAEAEKIESGEFRQKLAEAVAAALK